MRYLLMVKKKGFPMAEKLTFEMNPDHALTAFWVTWEALGIAIREIAKLTGDPKCIEALRAEMLAPFLANITETEAGLGVLDPAFTKHLRNFDTDAIRTGIAAVDAAVSRTVFR